MQWRSSASCASLMPLEVSYPPRILNPNRTAHWGKKHKAKKAYRDEVTVLARDALHRGLIALPETERVGLDLTFYPPWPPRKRDDDNVEAAFKCGRDALAAVLGIDDSLFEVTKRMMLCVRANGRGRVEIRLTAAR